MNAKLKVCLPVLVLVTCLRLHAQATLVTNTYSFRVINPTQTPMSSKTYDVHLLTESALIARYTAPQTHCTPLIIFFELDGVTVGFSDWVAAGETTGFTNLGPVSLGPHRLSFRAYGGLTGCGDGVLRQWDGTVDVVTSARACDFEWLTIERAGTNILVAWPQLPCNFVLEWSTSLPAANGWTRNTDTPARVREWLVVTNAVTATRFYRLRLE